MPRKKKSEPTNKLLAAASCSLGLLMALQQEDYKEAARRSASHHRSKSRSGESMSIDFKHCRIVRGKR